MKSKGLIITLMILLSIIIFLLVMFLVLALNGKLNFGKGFIGSKSDRIIVDETYDLDEISNIEMLSSAGDIKFEENTDKNVRFVIYGKNSDDVKIEEIDNKLKVDYKQEKNNFFGFNFDVNDIIIYIPNDYDGKITIDNNYGNNKFCDLENVNLDIEADCGNIETGKIKNANIKCSLGDVEIDTILNKCNIEADCGNIKINSLRIKEDSKIECDLGDVKIKDAKDVYIDAKVDLGDVKIDENNRSSNVTLRIDVDCGDVKVSSD